MKKVINMLIVCLVVKCLKAQIMQCPVYSVIQSTMIKKKHHKLKRLSLQLRHTAVIFPQYFHPSLNYNLLHVLL